MTLIVYRYRKLYSSFCKKQANFCRKLQSSTNRGYEFENYEISLYHFLKMSGHLTLKADSN